MRQPPFANQLHVIAAAILAASCAASAAFAQQPADPSPKPNIVLILVDDLGWTDLACYGSELYETPHIDRLARDGMKFTQNYSACTVCSPTRAALLTGKYPARLHITDWIPGPVPDNPKLIVPDWTKYLPLEEITIADALHERRLRHGQHRQVAPGRRGVLSREARLRHQHRPAPTCRTRSTTSRRTKLPRSPTAPKASTSPTGSRTKRSASSTANKDKPFFLYLPHFAVHLPLQAKQELIEKYRSQDQAGRWPRTTPSTRR